MSQTIASVWDDIVAWVATLNDWQSDAFNRIYLKRKLSSEDIAELGLLVRAHFGVPVELNGLRAKPFCLGSGSEARSAAVPTMLISMGKLTNVNAISPNETISFVDTDKPIPPKPKGLTIVYGANGSGKSGYSRVLKRACYARDSYVHTADARNTSGHSPILPDVFQADGGDVATAKFVWRINNEKRIVEWRDGERIADTLNFPTPPLAVFDSHCARAYVNKDNDVVYRPYGLDILEELARVYDILKKDIISDIEKIHIQLEDLRKKSVNTELAPVIEKLWNGKIPQGAVGKVAVIADSYTEKERQKLAELRAIFSEQDPKKKAEKLQGGVQRITVVSKEIAGFSQEIADDGVLEKFTRSLHNFAQAKANAEKINEGQFLDGTGGQLWEVMFEAARKFSKEAYPKSAFPYTEKCVLCQQPLGDSGKKLLEELQKIIKRGAVDIREQRKREMFRYLDKFKKMDISSERILHQSFIAELKEIASESGDDPSGIEKHVREYVKAQADRREQLLLAGESLVLKPLAPLPPNPINVLEKLTHWATKRSADLVEDRGKRQIELRQLEALDAFNKSIAAVRRLIHLWECHDALDSTKTTNVAKKLSEKAINKVLTDRINAEIDRLGRLAGNKRFHTHSHQQKARHKAQLQFDEFEGKHDLQSVLSEGEHQAIALACFFAEMSLDPSAVSCVVFDDPVSSLDHMRAKKVARRLREEAEDRQVIVFTHDLHFANLFAKQQARKVALRWDIVAPNKTVYGVVGDMPFEGKRVEAQIKDLKTKVKNVFSPSLSAMEREIELHKGYRDFRIALTRVVEEYLLCGAVARRFPEVKVGKMPEVFAHSDDKEEMSRQLKDLYGDSSDDVHGPSSEDAGTFQTPEEFGDAVKKLEAIYEKLKVWQR